MNSPAKASLLAGLLIGAGVLVLLWGGLLNSSHRGQPAIISVGDVAKSRRPGEWLTLTNAQLDLSDATASVLAPGRRPTELLVPLRSVGETGKANVLLVTKNPISLATFLQLHSYQSTTDARAWASKHADMVFPHRDAKGRVQAAGERKLTVDRLPTTLAPEYIVLEEGSPPLTSRHPSIVALGAALVVAGGFLALLRRKA